MTPVANISFIGVHKKVPIIQINLDRYIPDEIMFKPVDDLPETNVIFLQGNGCQVLPTIESF